VRFNKDSSIYGVVWWELYNTIQAKKKETTNFGAAFASNFFSHNLYSISCLVMWRFLGDFSNFLFNFYFFETFIKQGIEAPTLKFFTRCFSLHV